MGIGALHGLTRLVSLKLAGLKVTDEYCGCIAALAQLTELDLQSSLVGDAGVQGLSRLTSLKFLDLSWTKASAPPALSSLTRLHMDNCQVLPHSLRPLRGARSVTVLMKFTMHTVLALLRVVPAPSNMVCDGLMGAQSCLKQSAAIHLDVLCPMRRYADISFGAQVGGEVALRVLRSTRFPMLHELHMAKVQVDEAGSELLNAICSDSASTLRSLILPSASISTVRYVGRAVALQRLNLSGKTMQPFFMSLVRDLCIWLLERHQFPWWLGPMFNF